MILPDLPTDSLYNADLLSQTATDALNDLIAGDATPWNAWTLCQAGEYFMIPLILLLLLALYVAVARGRLLCKGAQLDNTFMQRIKDYVHDNEVESADNLCRKANTPSSRVVLRGIELLGHPLTDIHNSMTLSARIQEGMLKKNIKVLAFIAWGAPLLGLAGAFIGMLRYAFDLGTGAQAFSLSPLFMPWATFVGGLLIGFVALAAYYFLVSKLNRVQFTLNTTIARFLDILNEPSA